MKALAALVASLLCAAPAAAFAQDWPGNKPLRFEVITAAGGLVDIVPRELSSYVSTSIGVPVVVEDRPGGGGNIAASVVARAEPDGHMILVTSSNAAVNPTLLPNPGFDYERDLVPVAMAASAKMLLVASPAFPAKNITDVIAIAKQKPKSVSIAISVIGSPNQLAAEMLAQYSDSDLIFVPYESNIKAIPDLIAGRVDLAVATMPLLLPQVRNGALRALAVTSPQRSSFAPDVPTSAEAGLSQLQIDSWICFMTTGGTPAPTIARLDSEIAKALALPQVHDAFAKQGVDIFYMDSKHLGKFLHEEAGRFRGLLAHSQVR